LPVEAWRATGKGPDGSVLNKLYGDSAVPDTLNLRIPTAEFFETRGLRPDISLIIGRYTFGNRGYGNKDQPKYHFSPGAPVMMGHGLVMGPMMVGGAEFEELDEYGEPKDQEKPNKKHGHGTNKIFISITEFCFFDHNAQRAFGYGYDITETKRRDLSPYEFRIG
jgi:hypothetical protein